MANLLVIDSDVRDWVFIPLTLFIVLMKLVMQYMHVVRFRGPAGAGASPAREPYFNFHDDRLVGGAWAAQPNPHLAREFFRLLALCHTVIPEGERRWARREVGKALAAARLQWGVQVLEAHTCASQPPING